MTMTIHFCAGGDRNRSVSFGESAWLYYYCTRGGGGEVWFKFFHLNLLSEVWKNLSLNFAYLCSILPGG